jgi:hypothetical protein
MILRRVARDLLSIALMLAYGAVCRRGPLSQTRARLASSQSADRGIRWAALGETVYLFGSEQEH